MGLHKRNPQTIRLVECLHEAERRDLVGVAVVAPLTKAGIKALEEQRITRPEHANLERHVCSTWRRASGAYIGSVAGRDYASKVAALAVADEATASLMTIRSTPGR
jgi:hypothetical protein